VSVSRACVKSCVCDVPQGVTGGGKGNIGTVLI
jgi:hypothetical protein